MSSKNTSNVAGNLTLYKKKTVLTFMDDKPTRYKLAPLYGKAIENKDITYYAAKAAHVPESTIKMAMEGLFDAVNYFCAWGHGVQVPGLGMFKPRLNFKTVKTLDEADASTVTRKYLQFFPIGSIRRQCSVKNIKLKVIDLLDIDPKPEPEPEPEP